MPVDPLGRLQALMEDTGVLEERGGEKAEVYCEYELVCTQ